MSNKQQLEQLKEENRKLLFDILKDHPDIQKVEPEDDYVEIDVTLWAETDAEVFRKWADEVYQLLLKYPNSLFHIECECLDDWHGQPKVTVAYAQPEPQESFEARVTRELHHKAYWLFSCYIGLEHEVNLHTFDLLLKGMLKVSVDEFVEYLKELRDNGWTSSNK